MWKTWRRWGDRYALRGSDEINKKTRRYNSESENEREMILVERIKYIFGKKLYRFAFYVFSISSRFGVCALVFFFSFSFALSAVVVHFRWFYSNLLVLEPQFVSFLFVSLRFSYYLLRAYRFSSTLTPLRSIHLFVCSFMRCWLFHVFVLFLSTFGFLATFDIFHFDA